MRFAVVALVLCGAAQPVLAQDVAAVTDTSQKFAAAMSGADVASAAALFTEDAVVLPPGRGELTGKAQIQMFLSNMTRSVQDLRYTSESIKPVGDSGAREVGSFSFKAKGRNGQGAQDVSGKYLIVWEKAGGDWKIAADMWNRNGAPGGAQKRKGMGAKGGAGQGGDAGSE